MMMRASLRTKLMAGFGVLILALASCCVVGFVSIAKLSTATSTLDAALVKQKSVLGMELAVEEQRAGVRAFLLGNPNLDELEEGRRNSQTAADRLSSLLRTDEGKALFASLAQANAGYEHTLDRVIELRRAGKTKEAIALNWGPEANRDRTAVNAAFQTMAERQQNNENKATSEQHAAENQARWLLAIFAAAGLISGVAISILVSRAVSASLAGMISLIHEIAEKNLSAQDLQILSRDELGSAGSALNAMKNSLRGLIHSIARTAEHLASASEEISSSATQQAQGAETQKGQAAQVATAMQEMSATVQEVSDNSNRAADASRQAAETAREGGTVVEQSLAKMRAIAESVSATARKLEDLGKSSDQIGRIIGVIDDIADQTNLLALNAAIEAARAGEQGRGFAVVADEVRKLAERTTSATKEVAQMVQSIQEETKTAVGAMHEGTRQVEEGVKTTAQAGASLKQIIHMSEQVGEMITHIATAATEQASATEQVNQNVEQINRLVSESALGAQQSAKACQDLSGLALDLQKMVGSFQLEAASDAQAASHARTRASSEESSTRAFAAGA
ncbi:MAG TPA: methyl-accepting chemotaxis protein [Verrucomicrobiae bacterium]|nr:methyl-accepting chemotaxis protein [Verrucomicrobiae bacterium]